MMRALLPIFALMLAVPAMAQDYAQVSLPDPQQEQQATELMDSLRCLVCQGQPISGSNADLAADMRRIVRERIAAGETPDEVRQYLISRYGDWVSFEPQVRPMTLPLWLIPLLALGGGAVLVSRRLRRRVR
jgi:cytochrome c-type biogenesis protein CcmH